MSTLTLGETITYRTRTGGGVIVQCAEDNARPATFEAECQVCRAYSTGSRTDLGKTSEWARAHAAVCTALPEGYVDIEASAIEHAERAARMLAQLPTGADPDLLLPRIELHTRLAAVYADLARTSR